MDNANTKEELAEMLFKLIEDIGHTENLIEEIKQEMQLIKETFQNSMPHAEILSSIREELDRQSKIIDEFNSNININNITTLDENIKEKIISLENDINNIKNKNNSILDSININELSNISDTMAQKLILKKEIKTWQIMIIGILTTFSIFSIGFFIFISKISIGTILAYIAFCIPFCIAMYFINNNLHNLISNKKASQIKKN